jgi:uncharacterized membrane protein YcaP (DUF421 family)
MGSSIGTFLGLERQPDQLTFVQMSARAVIVFILTLAIVRIGNKRFLSSMSAFDAIVGFILASVLARAINGSASFFPTLGAGLVLVLLHRLFALSAFHSKKFEDLVKGHTNVLVRAGKPDPNIMRQHSITQADLLEEMRLHGNVDDLKRVETATLERSGEISVVPVKEKQQSG